LRVGDGLHAQAQILTERPALSIGAENLRSAPQRAVPYALLSATTDAR
jgi:hypothetical protein